MTETKVRPMNVVQLAIKLAETHRWDMVETLRVTGWASDGRGCVKLEGKARDALVKKGREKQGVPEKRIPGRTMDVARINELLYGKGMIFRCTNVTRYEDTHNLYPYPVYTLTALTGRAVKVNGEWYETIIKHHPAAETFIPDEKNKPVLFRVGTDTVAILMPIPE